MQLSRLYALVLACLLIGAAPLALAQAAASPVLTGNLLAGRQPSSATGVRKPARLTDGVMAVDGDHWKTDLTSILGSARARVVWDLGAAVEIRAALLQADNNDEYELRISDDGERWAPLWRAQAARHPGQQTRFSGDLRGQGRYLELTANGGDGSYALGEVQVFATRPAPFPPSVERRVGAWVDDELNRALLVGAALLGLFVLLTSAGASRAWKLTTLLLPVLAVAAFLRGLDLAWPPAAREVSLARAVAAGLAAVVVARESLLPRWLARIARRRGQRGDAHGAPPHVADRRVSAGVLALAAALAVASFYNLGRPQFWDHAEERPSVVHNFDMRVYYPIAKYFRELRFDGLYQASVMAYVDDVPGTTLDSVGQVTLRDLRTHRITTVAEVRPAIESVKARFSPERWQEFLGDMRYFRETMGLRDYLGSMHDHGGNATPVWFAVTHLLFRWTQASDAVLVIGGLLDPLLLGLSLVAVWRAFGPRTALLCAVIFGANDFYMFGSDWAFATLRHDWMALLAFGASAIRRRWYALGGALWAWSGLIRAFPAMALLACALPALWWLVERRRSLGRWPSARAVRSALRPLVRTAAGALAATVVLVLFAGLVLSFDAWLDWFEKIQLIASGPHVNHTALRALVAFDPSTTLRALELTQGGDWGVLQSRTFSRRWAIYALLALLFIALVMLASRRRRLDTAGVLGLTLVPILLYPANYYAHFVFLLPVLVVERPDRAMPVSARGALLWLLPLVMCAVAYATVDPFVRQIDLHFVYNSASLCATLLAVLVLLVLPRSRARRRARAET